jgi:hypothetical protein
MQTIILHSPVLSYCSPQTVFCFPPEILPRAPCSVESPPGGPPQPDLQHWIAGSFLKPGPGKSLLTTAMPGVCPFVQEKNYPLQFGNHLCDYFSVQDFRGSTWMPSWIVGCRNSLGWNQCLLELLVRMKSQKKTDTFDSHAQASLRCQNAFQNPLREKLRFIILVPNTFAHYKLVQFLFLKNPLSKQNIF